MSRGAGYLDQVVELDFQYPSEGIHKRWDGGYRITAMASTPDQVWRGGVWGAGCELRCSVDVACDRCSWGVCRRERLRCAWPAPCPPASACLHPPLMCRDAPVMGPYLRRLPPAACCLLPPTHPPTAAFVQSAFVLSIPRRAMSDETQETLRTSTFPSGAPAPGAAWCRLVPPGAAWCLLPPGHRQASCSGVCRRRRRVYAMQRALHVLACFLRWAPCSQALMGGAVPAAPLQSTSRRSGPRTST